MVHECMDSLALIGHANSSLEQTCRDSLLFGQSVPCLKEECAESEFLFGDDSPKRIMNVTTNKKLFIMSSKPYNKKSHKTSKNLC